MQPAAKDLCWAPLHRDESSARRVDRGQTDRSCHRQTVVSLSAQHPPDWVPVLQPCLWDTSGSCPPTFAGGQSKAAAHATCGLFVQGTPGTARFRLASLPMC